MRSEKSLLIFFWVDLLPLCIEKSGMERLADSFLHKGYGGKCMKKRSTFTSSLVIISAICNTTAYGKGCGGKKNRHLERKPFLLS